MIVRSVSATSASLYCAQDNFFHTPDLRIEEILKTTFPKGLAFALVAMFSCALTACAGSTSGSDATESPNAVANNTYVKPTTEPTSDETKASIENALNLANMTGVTWTYGNDAWTMSIVTAVTNPEIADEQGVSVCVPASYVAGIDTDGDGNVDETSEGATAAIAGKLIINKEARITSSNGQIYTPSTAPIILNTGAAGYSSSSNTQASSAYAKEGYINVACGNRGKQDTPPTRTAARITPGTRLAALWTRRTRRAL